MTPTDLSIKRIRAWRKASGWSVNRLGTESGLNESTLRDIDSERWNPRADTLRQIEAVIPPGWQPGDPLPDEDDPPLAAPLSALRQAQGEGDGEGPQDRGLLRQAQDEEGGEAAAAPPVGPFDGAQGEEAA